MKQLAPGVWETAHLEELQGWVLKVISRDQNRFLCEARHPDGEVRKVYVCDRKEDLLTPDGMDDDWDPIER